MSTSDFFFDSSHAVSRDQEALFLERWGLFLERSLNDLRDFAEREGRDFLQLRLDMARWNSKFLFDFERQQNNVPNIDFSAKENVNNILSNVSSTLESICGATGHHSFVIMVDPEDETNEAFLGGTEFGREFWSGMRNGGASGVRNFKEYCRNMSNNNSIIPMSDSMAAIQRSNSRSSLSAPSTVLKNLLYTEMRSRLRNVSGIRNAEMKWSKPENLATYGVSLVGWPPEIRYKNPSQMSSHERSIIMRLLGEKKLYFRLTEDRENNGDSFVSQDGLNPDEDVSWAIRTGPITARGPEDYTITRDLLDN